MKIVLATRNRGKIREINKILSDLPVEIASLLDFPECPMAAETHDTYMENAREKARVAAKFCGTWALADDSGLEVEALDGDPGVKSARYAGEGVSYDDNNQKILAALKGVSTEGREALFRCYMVLQNPEGREWVTDGELRGRIADKPVGEHGFGYDPIFFLPEEGKTLAQMTLQEKNQISHRTQALQKMKHQLLNLL